MMEVIIPEVETLLTMELMGLIPEVETLLTIKLMGLTYEDAELKIMGAPK